MQKVIYASSKNSDMLYLTKVVVPDPYFLVDDGKQKYVFLDKREYGVFKEKNKNKNIELILLDPLLSEASKLKDDTETENRLAKVLFTKYLNILEEVYVPNSFPLRMADFLRSCGYKIQPLKEFNPERKVKSKREIELIEASLKSNHKAFEKVEEILRESSIKGRYIYYRDDLVTSEFLKARVDEALLQEDMLNVEDLIISSKEEAAIPHHTGRGPILANETIICDIFPIKRSTGYFADTTRTYVKGKPSDEIKRMYEAVLASQTEGIKAAKPGVLAQNVHNACAKVFQDLGFDVGERGFIHGTGHGLGLDIHEEPYLNAISESVLEVGNVVTVEPGLYYPGVGGVRIEDVIVITEDGNRNLTNYNKASPFID